MALSLNEMLADSQIKRQLQLQRLATHEANKVLAIMQELNEELKKLTIDIDPTAVSRLKYRNERVKKLMDEGESIIGTRFAEAYREFRNDMYDFAGLEMSHTVESINTAVGFVVAKASIEKEVVRSVVNEVYMDGGLLKDWFGRASESFRMGFQKEIRAGMTAGEGIEKIVRRLIGNKRDFPGEPSLYDKQKKGMEGLVRTAVMTVANDAHQEVYAENEDLFKGYYWLATLDNQTCEICAVYDLKEWDLDHQPMGHAFEYHEAPMHRGCRCIILPILKTYRELGFDIDEREGQRAATGGYVPRDMDFETWMSRQGEDFQRNYFGHGRYALYKAGRITLTDLITQRGRPLTLDELCSVATIDPRIARFTQANAVIPDTKLTKYALDPNNPSGRHKAFVFQSALGYNLSNANKLAEAILTGLEDSGRHFVGTTQYGDRFNAIITLKGPNGNTAKVRTGWILRPGEDKYSLVTAFVMKKKGKGNED